MISTLARRRWGCLSAIVAVGVAAAMWAGHGPTAEALREHPYFAISQLVISGCGPALTPEDLRDWLGFTGEATLWDASPARVRARLEAHPFIARAVVRRVFPSRLEVVVRERRPQAIAVLGDDLYYVDRGGLTFGPLRPQDSRDYPVITGLESGTAEGPRTWALRRALRLLRRCDRAPCLGELSEVHLEDGRGVVVFPASPRLPIVLGWGSWPVKLERAGRALQAWHGAAEGLAGLDVRFRNQVVLTLRSAAAAATVPAKGAAKPQSPAPAPLRQAQGERHAPADSVPHLRREGPAHTGPNRPVEA
jgi:cell division protein FtsQ